MTWPQYRRGVCFYYGSRVRLSNNEAELLSTLLLRRDRFVSVNDLIEALYLDPDHEPDYARDCVAHALCRLREKLPGLIETHHRRGYLIPIPQELALAA